MSQALTSLKLVNAKRENTLDPIQSRRNKLNEKLKFQIVMAQAMSRDESFTLKRVNKITDKFSGQTSTIGLSKRVKTWCFTNSYTKMIAVQLYYENKVVNLAKGKNAIEVSNNDKLIAALIKLQDAVLHGYLDSQISMVVNGLNSKYNIQVHEYFNAYAESHLRLI